MAIRVIHTSNKSHTQCLDNRSTDLLSTKGNIGLQSFIGDKIESKRTDINMSLELKHSFKYKRHNLLDLNYFLPFDLYTWMKYEFNLLKLHYCHTPKATKLRHINIHYAAQISSGFSLLLSFSK